MVFKKVYKNQKSKIKDVMCVSDVKKKCLKFKREKKNDKINEILIWISFCNFNFL